MDMNLVNLVMDRMAWCAAIHALAKSRTRLSNWTELSADDTKIQKTHKRLIAQIFPKQNRMDLPSLFSWDKLIGRVWESTHFKVQVSHRTQNYLRWYLSRSRKVSLSDTKLQLGREKSEFSKETTRILTSLNVQVCSCDFINLTIICFLSVCVWNISTPFLLRWVFGCLLFFLSIHPNLVTYSTYTLTSTEELMLLLEPEVLAIQWPYPFSGPSTLMSARCCCSA